MEQEDYIKRHLDLISKMPGKVLAGLLGVKQQGTGIEQIAAAKQTLINELFIEVDAMLQLSDEDLISRLQNEKYFSYENIEQLADILYLIANNERDIIKRNSIYEKCLFMYNFTENNETTYSIERHSKIMRLKNLSDN